MSDQPTSSPDPRSPQPPVSYALADGVATIRLERPEAMNSLDTATKEALLSAVLQAAGDEAVRCVVLTGSGRAFCVGQDLKEHVGLIEHDPDGEALFRTVPEHYNPLALALATMAKPVVAAVNGVAAGAGASLAFACDLRLLADTAGFNLAFTGIGLSCDTGASWTLPRMVGQAVALDLLMRPRTVGAEESLQLGLATEVVPGAELAARAHEVAAALAAGPTVAYASVRRAVRAAAALDLPAALEHEAGLMALTGSTEDHRAAVRSFVAKEKPVFRGR